MNTLGSRLRKLRYEHKLTLDDVGKAVGTNRVSAHHWENDKAEPKAKALSLLARHFNVSADYLLFGLEEEKNNRIINLSHKIESLIKDKKLNSTQIKLIDDQIIFLENMINSWVNTESSSESKAQKTA